MSSTDWVADAKRYNGGPTVPLGHVCLAATQDRGHRLPPVFLESPSRPGMEIRRQEVNDWNTLQ